MEGTYLLEKAFGWYGKTTLSDSSVLGCADGV